MGIVRKINMNMVSFGDMITAMCLTTWHVRALSEKIISLTSSDENDLLKKEKCEVEESL